MSAPEVAVVLADHIGLMLVEIASALNRHGIENGYGDGFARVRIEHKMHVSQSFHAFIDEEERTFHATGSDGGIALLKANSERQTFYEARAALAKHPTSPKDAA